MGITRTVTTQVYCDVCGKWVIGWESEETGVSREWAKYHARCKGCTAGQKVICKECRIKQRIKKCSLQKKWGAAGMDGGACLGFSHDGDDEPIERCKRYSSWERGTNEVTNKMIRRKIPKGTNFDDRTEEEVESIENWINGYPRKIHGYHSAGELFEEEVKQLA